ncbi:hypothetical protein ACFWUZ_20565 [Streptomyces sp. NPDC058646]|uniref:hypothetical protein n=1 Tax=Streptomyces sp. NPDC058646 TaxID=3346574 RepID=UPI003654F725
MAIIAGAGRLQANGLGLGFTKPAVCLYDFAVDGGGTTAINLRGNSTIPVGAIITDTLLRVETPLTGGTVTDTVQLNAEGAADLQAAAARNASPWSTAGVRRLTLDADAAPVELTAERTIQLKVNGTAVTAGKFKLIVWYVELA